MIINKGSLYVEKDMHDSSECKVYICLAQNKFLVFTCKNNSIIENVIRLKIGSKNAPSWNIIDNLPDSAEEGCPLSKTSLNQLLKTQQIHF